MYPCWIVYVYKSCLFIIYYLFILLKNVIFFYLTYSTYVNICLLVWGTLLIGELLLFFSFQGSLLSLLTKVSTNTLKLNVGLLNHKYCKVAAGYCKKIANCLNNYYRD